MSIYCHTARDYSSGKTPNTWGIKNRPLWGSGRSLLVSILLARDRTYPPDAIVYWVGFNDFFIKQLEIIKRPATFLLTQNVLTINLPKLAFRLYKRQTLML